MSMRDQIINAVGLGDNILDCNSPTVSGLLGRMRAIVQVMRTRKILNKLINRGLGGVSDHNFIISTTKPKIIFFF